MVNRNVATLQHLAGTKPLKKYEESFTAPDQTLNGYNNWITNVWLTQNDGNGGYYAPHQISGNTMWTGVYCNQNTQGYVAASYNSKFLINNFSVLKGSMQIRKYVVGTADRIYGGFSFGGESTEVMGVRFYAYMGGSSALIALNGTGSAQSSDIAMPNSTWYNFEIEITKTYAKAWLYPVGSPRPPAPTFKCASNIIDFNYLVNKHCGVYSRIHCNNENKTLWTYMKNLKITIQ